jgi:hypothetical protein
MVWLRTKLRSIVVAGQGRGKFLATTRRRVRCVRQDLATFARVCANSRSRNMHDMARDVVSAKSWGFSAGERGMMQRGSEGRERGVVR